MDSWSGEMNPPSKDMGFYPARLNRARRGPSPPPPWQVFSYIIYFFLDYLGPTLVSHPCLYLIARPISHSFWRSTSYGDSDSTVQGSCPHKWDQDVSCGYLMRRWQLILELLFHYSSIAVSLHLCFPLGCFGKLPLVACRFLLPWFWYAENKIVLSNISWQFVSRSKFVELEFRYMTNLLNLDTWLTCWIYITY